MDILNKINTILNEQDNFDKKFLSAVQNAIQIHSEEGMEDMDPDDIADYISGQLGGKILTTQERVYIRKKWKETIG